MHYQNEHLAMAVHMPHQQPVVRDQQRLHSGLTASKQHPLSPPSRNSGFALPICWGASQPVLSQHEHAFGAPSAFVWLQKGASEQASVVSHQFAGHQSVAGLTPIADAPHSIALLPQGAPLLPQNPAWGSARRKSRIDYSEGIYFEFHPDSRLDAHSSLEEERQSEACPPQGLSPEQAAPASRSTCQVHAGRAKPRGAIQTPLALSACGAGLGSTAAAPPDAAENSSAPLLAAEAAVEASAVEGTTGTAGDSSAAAAAACFAGEASAGAPATRSANGASTATAGTGAAGEASATAVAVDTDDSPAGAVSAADAAGETSAAAPAPEAAVTSLQVDWICTHPYVRLPVLQRVVPPRIQLSASNFVSSSASSTLLCIRYLFMKQALEQIDVAFLARELAIASAAQTQGAKWLPRSVLGVANTGQQFLVLDAIVSALHVLGVSPPSFTWWVAFIECFDTRYR
ncbi:hypothetical protein EPH_0058470 [Eimeria praecox]|uniref:Uncharacterized protein n=1 Tax=Eimeria praecox TaxID=51316 RepID=U6H7C5_9EIME|nr:hypothetical protein EPH_0058470 [Eimeria praecox]